MSLNKKEGPVSHSREKRKAMQEDGQRAKRIAEPVPLDGSGLPDPKEGWVQVRSDDPTLYVAGVKVIPMSDGTTRRYVQVLVKPAEVRQMKKRVKRLAKKIKREDAKAAKKASRSAAREFLFRMGKL